MCPERRRSPLPPILLLASLLAACAPAATTTETGLPTAAAADLPPIPICRDELRAYLELARLAKLHGDGWIVFEPAVDALKQQIINCIDDNRAQFRGL
jgi:hypothetical protein